jgi:hypothetical protein
VGVGWGGGWVAGERVGVRGVEESEGGPAVGKRRAWEREREASEVSPSAEGNSAKPGLDKELWGTRGMEVVGD